MNTRLPQDLERFVQAQVRCGRFRSSDESTDMGKGFDSLA